MERISYSGWYKINARADYIQKLDDNNYHFLPCKTNEGTLYCRCKVIGNVALPDGDEWYRITKR